MKERFTIFKIYSSLKECWRVQQFTEFNNYDHAKNAELVYIRSAKSLQVATTLIYICVSL